MTIDFKVIALLAGMLIGVAIIFDVRYTRTSGLSPYAVLAFIGCFFSMVLTWACFDGLEAIKNPDRIIQVVQPEIGEERS
jgi:hypothetical protein